MSDTWKALAAPFPPAAVSWRAQNVSYKDNRYSALALAYIDARDVMDRLDAVVGPENWQDSYTEAATGRVICTIAIKIGDQWVSKSDGAGNTDIEGDKGGISDAFKRAAVKWGIGRYLYSISSPWAACEGSSKGDKHYWRKWTPEGRKKLDQILEAHSRQFQQARDEGQSQRGAVSPRPDTGLKPSPPRPEPRQVLEGPCTSWTALMAAYRALDRDLRGFGDSDEFEAHLKTKEVGDLKKQLMRYAPWIVSNGYERPADEPAEFETLQTLVEARRADFRNLEQLKEPA